MPKTAELYDGTILEFPDETPESVVRNKAREITEQIREKSNSGLPSNSALARAHNPTLGMSTTQKVLAGMGGELQGLYLGGKQMLGLADAEEAQKKAKIDAPLKATKAGKVGGFLGNLLPAAATAFIPGINTYTGASLAGAGLGVLQPTQDNNIDSRARNAALGAGLGALGKFGGDKLAQALKRYSQSLGQQSIANEVRDATLDHTLDAGYVIPPSYSHHSGRGSRLAEALSGKYKTNQAAGIRNQGVTNRLAAQSLGIADDTPITPELLRTIRKQTFDDGYTPIRYAGEVKVDDDYIQALSQITEGAENAAKSFPQSSLGQDITKSIDELLVDSFDAGAGVDQVRILREQADSAFRSGNNALGKALRSASEAIEDQIERHLAYSGDDGARLLEGFRKARQRIAMTHSVENALVPATGDVSAVQLGNSLNRGKPLSGELETIGKFGQAYRDVAGVPKSGHANDFTVLDMATAGYGAGSGNAPMIALPAVRVASRNLALSKVLQEGLRSPDYQASLLAKALQQPAANAAVRATPLALLPAATSN